MDNKERPIHEQCSQHPLKCKSINDIQKDMAKMQKDMLRIWNSIGERIKTQTLLAFLAILTTIYAGAFLFSVAMNSSAISSAQSYIDLYRDRQQQLQIDIKVLQTRIEALTNEVRRSNGGGKDK